MTEGITGRFRHLASTHDVQRIVMHMRSAIISVWSSLTASPLFKRPTRIAGKNCPKKLCPAKDPVVVSGTLSPETDIFSPAGMSTCATPGELHDCAIGSAGTWTTLIWDTSGTGTGTFTLSAVDLDLTPLSGPAGTPVTVSSGGFKSGETVKVKYETELASPATVLICHGTASATGTVSCSGIVPTAKAGAAGRHVVQAVGSTSAQRQAGLSPLPDPGTAQSPACRPAIQAHGSGDHLGTTRHAPH